MTAEHNTNEFSSYKWFGSCLSGVHLRKQIIVREITLKYWGGFLLSVLRMNEYRAAITHNDSKV